MESTSGLILDQAVRQHHQSLPPGPLAVRLLRALEAGQAAGGGYGGNHSVALRAAAPARALLRVDPPAEWLDLDSTLRQEVADRLARLGHDDLRTWMGWQNLEDRWVGEQHLDPVVLDELRRLSAGPS